MFTTAERTRLRDDLVETARADEEIVGAALVGSAAAGLEDAWSDIDLVLQVSAGTTAEDVISRWTRTLYNRDGAVHHLDVTADGVLYRVFFLDSSLQVDISFWPEDQFRVTSLSCWRVCATSSTHITDGEQIAYLPRSWTHSGTLARRQPRNQNWRARTIPWYGYSSTRSPSRIRRSAHD